MTSAPQKVATKRKRDVLTRLREVLRGSTGFRFQDRGGVSARLQWAAMLVLTDRADANGEIPERFTPTATELAKVTYSDERQARRVLDVLAEIGLVTVRLNPGKRSTITLRDGDETAVEDEGAEAVQGEPETPGVTPAHPGHDASPDTTPDLASRQPCQDATPGMTPAHPWHDASPTPGVTPAHPWHDASPPPYVGSLVGSHSGITCGISAEQAPREGSPESTPVLKPVKPPKAKADSTPVWEAYRDGYAAANDGEQPPRDAATNAAIVRLVRAIGLADAERLVKDVFASPEARKRYPSMLAIAKDAAAVRAAVASSQKGHGLTEGQRKFARSLYQRHPKHHVSKLLHDERREPTLAEFEELVAFDKANPSNGRRTAVQPTEGWQPVQRKREHA